MQGKVLSKEFESDINSRTENEMFQKHITYYAIFISHPRIVSHCSERVADSVLSTLLVDCLRHAVCCVLQRRAFLLWLS